MQKNLSSKPTIVSKIRTADGLPFVDFVHYALYDPEVGYYTQSRERVGARPSSDFITNLSVRSIFAPMIVEAVGKLLPGEDLSLYTFYEIGAEPNSSLLQNINHPFAGTEVIRQGDQHLPGKHDRMVLFANEWLDALPFVRLVYREDGWKELCVRVRENNSAELYYSEEDPRSQDAIELVKELKDGRYPEGYRLDLSLKAEKEMAQWLHPEWKGLFLTFDYGSSWEALTKALPDGTARAYYHHQQSQNLLAHPGEQDLTCNLCWDRLVSQLEKNNFAAGKILRQESFLLQYAEQTLRKKIENQGPEGIEERARILQLIHPTHMGAAFQVLTGVRI